MNSLRFILPENTVGGTLLENGTWTGVMGLINNDKVDFAANYFVFTSNRLTINRDSLSIVFGQSAGHIIYIKKSAWLPGLFQSLHSFTMAFHITMLHYLYYLYMFHY